MKTRGRKRRSIGESQLNSTSTKKQKVYKAIVVHETDDEALPIPHTTTCSSVTTQEETEEYVCGSNREKSDGVDLTQYTSKIPIESAEASFVSFPTPSSSPLNAENKSKILNDIIEVITGKLDTFLITMKKELGTMKLSSVKQFSSEFGKSNEEKESTGREQHQQGLTADIPELRSIAKNLNSGLHELKHFKSNVEEEVRANIVLESEEIINNAYCIAASVEAEAAKKKRDYLQEIENCEKKFGNHSDIIELHVGHKYFTTKLSTLCSEPNSLLASIFSGKFDVVKDAKGLIFIDRSPEIFKYILSYLRNIEELENQSISPSIILPPLESESLKLLEVEARYFKIHGLLTLIETTFISANSNSNSNSTTTISTAETSNNALLHTN